VTPEPLAAPGSSDLPADFDFVFLSLTIVSNFIYFISQIALQLKWQMQASCVGRNSDGLFTT
jgi:hypothetical protein